MSVTIELSSKSISFSCRSPLAPVLLLLLLLALPFPPPFALALPLVLLLLPNCVMEGVVVGCEVDIDGVDGINLDVPPMSGLANTLALELVTNKGVDVSLADDMS